MIHRSKNLIIFESTKKNMEFIHSDTVNFIARKNTDRNFSKQKLNGGFQQQQYQHRQQQQYNTQHQQRTQATHSNNGAYPQAQQLHNRQQQQLSGQKPCFNCGSTYHLARHCNRPKKSQRFNNTKPYNKTVFHDLNNIVFENDFEYQYLNNLYLFDSQTKQGALTGIFNINGQKVKMEIDTGAGGTVIQIDQFRSLFSNIKLSDSEQLFTLYTGEHVSVVGNCTVIVTHREKRHFLKLSVVNVLSGALPLMGRDWLDVLYPGWRTFFDIGSSIECINKLNDFNMENYTNSLKSKYKRVFSNSRTLC